jgi:hypothetical protein
MTGRNPDAPYKIAILWRGDADVRRAATPSNNRFHLVFEELVAVGIEAEPAVYDETFAEEVRAQLLAVDGVLVWVDPIHQGKTRAMLDALLRDVAARGPWVSAHPDTILKMGVKEVLYRTKHLGWGRIPICTALSPSSAMPFRPGFDRRVRASSSRIAAMAAAGSGRSISFRRKLARIAWCECCTRSGGAFPRICRFAISSHVAKPISGGAGALLTSRFSRACPPG